ncbi:hypothetical protein [Rhodanobacter glycinis]|uniref:hypothetical protein n=1 Tax=Rhodanobacter glycinis TaxID=582702 RepID=UPI00158713B7|nr:hypothetical protein [Rhodanobacter glycinis]
MKTRLFLSSTAALAAALLAAPALATNLPTQNHQVAAVVAGSLPANPTTLVPDLTIAPADQQVAFASHESHSSHASHSSHSSHTSSSFV